MAKDNFEFGQKYHTPFQERCRGFVEEHGGKWYNPTIHNKMPKSIDDQISLYRTDMTAFYIRDLNDDFVTYGEGYSHFQEYKIMSDWPERGIVGRARANTMLEAGAFGIHYHDAKIGVKTLYWIQDPFTGKEYGLLLSKDTYKDQVFKDNQIWYPAQQKNHDSRVVFEDFFNEVFVDRIDEIEHYDYFKLGQSPDPYILIENSTLEPIEKFHRQLMPLTKEEPQYDFIQNLEENPEGAEFHDEDFEEWVINEK